MCVAEKDEKGVGEEGHIIMVYKVGFNGKESQQQSKKNLEIKCK